VTRPAAGPWPTSATRTVVLLGWPARHSLSPTMHNAAFAEQGIDLVYLALPTAPEDLGRVVGALGAVGTVGANVTVPHKQAVIPLCDALTEEAELVGAVNTLVWGADGLIGDNTDAAGLGLVLRDDLGLRAGTSVVVFGTGGAARAAAVALGRSGASVRIVGRRREAAAELAQLARTCGAHRATGVDLADAAATADAVRRSALAINATPLGMGGERLPGPFHALTRDQVALDLIYRPPETPFLADARAAGADPHHGLGMLVGQAALSYRRWTGRDAPVGTMSAVALAALSG
jgi:shikimate dehydrogenase